MYHFAVILVIVFEASEKLKGGLHLNSVEFTFGHVRGEGGTEAAMGKL